MPSCSAVSLLNIHSNLRARSTYFEMRHLLSRRHASLCDSQPTSGPFVRPPCVKSRQELQCVTNIFSLFRSSAVVAGQECFVKTVSVFSQRLKATVYFDCMCRFTSHLTPPFWVSSQYSYHLYYFAVNLVSQSVRSSSWNACTLYLPMFSNIGEPCS